MDWHLFSKLVTEPHDPVADLANATCPFLAIFGALDGLLPAWKGAEDLGSALAAAGNTDATVTVFPNGNHRIQDQTTRELVTGYLETLGGWTAHRALP